MPGTGPHPARQIRDVAGDGSRRPCRGALFSGRLDTVPHDSDEVGYLRRIETLAAHVVDCADSEGWLCYPADPDDATPLQKAVNELGRNLRHIHSDDDGCIGGHDEEPRLND
jgi:hypothetical protein